MHGHAATLLLIRASFARGHLAAHCSATLFCLFRQSATLAKLVEVICLCQMAVCSPLMLVFRRFVSVFLHVRVFSFVCVCVCVCGPAGFEFRNTRPPAHPSQPHE